MEFVGALGLTALPAERPLFGRAAELITRPELRNMFIMLYIHFINIGMHLFRGSRPLQL